MAAEKFIFKNFTNVTKTDCFTDLNDDEIHELIEAAIESEYCSTNEILSGLHRWVVTKLVDQNPQFEDGRVNTFLILVKKLPRDEFDEKIFAEIFLDDNRLRDNAMCRSFRDEYLCDLFKRYSERNNSNGSAASSTRGIPKRGMKRKAAHVEEEESPRRLIITGALQEPLVATSGKSAAHVEEEESPRRLIITDALQEPLVATAGKSAYTESFSTQEPSASSSGVQQAVQRLSFSSTNVLQVAVAGPVTDEKDRLTSSRGLVESGKSTKVIRGGNGSDCIVYFTSKENGSWFIGSFNLATGNVENITNLPNYREDGALIHAYNYLYFVGGRIVRDASSGMKYTDGQEEVGQVSRRIDIFDMTARKWIIENLPQLNVARDYFQKCVLDQYIYIIGRRTDGTKIDLVERIPLRGIIKRRLPCICTMIYSLQEDMYNIDTGKWTKIPKIPGARTEHSIAVWDGKLYVFGGIRSGTRSYKLASACMYNRTLNDWTMIPNMYRNRCNAATVVHNNYIYIIGGDGDKSLTIEKFNPMTHEFEIIHNWLNKVPSDVNFYLIAHHIE